MSFAIRSALVVLLLVHSAAAEPAWNISARIAASQGTMEESTWSYPEIDVVGSYRIGTRGFVAAAGGLTSIDNHTFLSDGRDYRFELSGGATVVQRLRAGLLLGFESITFHADPDVLAEHPDVDILASRGSLIPTLGIALSYPVGSALVGVFNRAALRKLELFDTPGGDSLSSRLLLFGAYVELRLK